MIKKLKYLIAKGMKILLNPPAIRNCEIDKKAAVCSRSELSGCSVGRYSYVGSQGFLVNVSIGQFCSVADRCSIGGASHPMEFVSTSPVFHAGKNVLKTNFSSHKIPHTAKTIVENDVWIGQGAFVKAGVRIDTGAVIGMGAVVTHDVGPYEVWAGNPAKMIRKRFDEETIRMLLDSQWWNWDEQRLKTYAAYFNDPGKLMEMLSGEEEVKR